jgi:hypothetical protein
MWRRSAMKALKECHVGVRTPTSFAARPSSFVQPLRLPLAKSGTWLQAE